MHTFRSAFTSLLLPVLGLLLCAVRAAGGPAPTPTVSPVIWEAPLTDFSAETYAVEVERLIAKFEASIGQRLVPGAKHRVGLKIYTDSGPGLATPIPLTQAVIAALERRGYAKSDIFLVGLNQQRLRFTGYLPSLVTGRSAFEGHKVYVLESGRYFDPVWFYDSPLPSRFDPILAQKSVENVDSETTLEQDRKSFLATPLFVDADFWINLPVYTDHPVLGVNGALVNATLWNASNTARFFRSPASAPAAVAEMSAIPELRHTWMFTLASLERYQFIGGPWFNSLYTVSEPRLWLGTDPVLMDALMQERINRWRQRTGFKPIPDDIRTLEFAAVLGVGSRKTADAKFVPVGN
ncbi:MAG: DUF362 domain-containing protein [Verrucomicrobia bacterium]|nr:DUF362 domain-containing protein [Verrucomicrobiota bacterium]